MNATTSLAFHHEPNDRIAATIAHLGTVVAWFLAPLIVYLVLPRSSRWARFQALQSLLWSLLGTLVSLATCGLAIPVFLVWHAIAAIKTLSGDEYLYPLVGDAARRAVYGDGV
jgi:uncharacterized Tic20 family protein